MLDNKNEVRVSCAHLSIIKVGEQYAVLKAKGSMTPKYSAVGGHMRVNPDAKIYLEQKCGARFRSKSNDLILYLLESQVGTFRDWFRRREGRDTISNELREELTEENSILDTLDGLTVQFNTSHEDTAISTRKEHAGEITYYFIDVYDVTLLPNQQQSMRDFAARDDTLALLTTEELKQKTYNGIKLQTDIIRQYL